jgi:D-alanyl-D-alanine endopeptidase (penicillin-binding protein 7)
LFEPVERLLLAVQRHPSARLKPALSALLLACASTLVQAGSAQISSGLVTLAPPAATRVADKPDAPASAQLQLPLNARHVLVMEQGSGKVVMAKDADVVVPIASLTKLMTAMVLLDAKLDPAEPLRITQDDVDTLKHSRSHVPVGSQMSRLAALKLALMSSDNRAAAALARTYPGGGSAFAQAVQAKIRSLGLTRTAIAEPTGLSPANTSTANEVAKIVAAAARYPEIAQITSGKQASVPVNGRPRELHNTNRLVGGKGWDIRLSKTGYTEEAGRCLTMLIKSGARIFTVVLLDADGSPQRLRDALRIRQSLAKLPTR